MEPETIVAAVAQKTVSKITKHQRGIPWATVLFSAVYIPRMKKSGLPTSPPRPPLNIKPKPMSQKQGVPMQKSIIFFIRMLPVFFALVRPASQSANPACIK